METYFGIPVIDIGLSRNDRETSKHLLSALAEVGFVYIKTQDIDQCQVPWVLSKLASPSSLLYVHAMNIRAFIFANNKHDALSVHIPTDSLAVSEDVSFCTC